MTEIAIVGDRFMLPRVFAAEIIAACGPDHAIRTQEQPWPDEPMAHGYAGDVLAGLKEYFGEPDAIVDFIGAAEIFVTHLAPVTAAMLERLPGLRLIAVSRGGPVNIDMAAAWERGIAVVNTPGRNASAVAEFTIGGILSETRRIRDGHESLRGGIWRGDLYRADITGRELSELTVGVVGYGALFVNTARGPLADYEALTEALRSGHLGGAVLDTFAVEPVPADWPLLAMPNVTLTPHIAGASMRTVTYAAEQAAAELRRYLRGEPLVNLC